MADRAVGQADIQVRLMPITGSGIAANWAAHQLAELKRTSATFGYELEPAVIEFRDRLIDWQNRPARARKIFRNDLDRWTLQNSTTEKSLLAEQEVWVARQHHNEFTGPEAASASAAVHLNGGPLNTEQVNTVPPVTGPITYEPITRPSPLSTT